MSDAKGEAWLRPCAWDLYACQDQERTATQTTMEKDTKLVHSLALRETSGENGQKRTACRQTHAAAPRSGPSRPPAPASAAFPSVCAPPEHEYNPCQ